MNQLWLHERGLVEFTILNGHTILTPALPEDYMVGMSLLNEAQEPSASIIKLGKDLEVEFEQRATLTFSHDPQAMGKAFCYSEFPLLEGMLGRRENLTRKGESAVFTRGVSYMLECALKESFDAYIEVKQLTSYWNCTYLRAILESPGVAPLPEISLPYLDNEVKCNTSVVSLKTVFFMRKGIEILALHRGSSGDIRKRMMTPILYQLPSQSLVPLRGTNRCKLLKLLRQHLFMVFPL